MNMREHHVGRLITIFIGLLAIGIIVLSSFLSPDDIKDCDSQPSAKSGCQSVDAIVAISGGHTKERTAEAISLYKRGWAPKVIFSGAAADINSPSNAAVMRKQAIEAGIPAESVIVEEFGRTTKQNAEQAKNIFKSYELKRIMLVTSPYHQRRAGLEFQSIAGSSVVVLNHPTPTDPDWGAFWWLTPRGWWLAGSEVIKIIAFYGGQSE